jgi:hypothetical protein
MTRSLFLTQLVLVIGLWVGLMVFGRSQMFRDPGTFWHTATGEQILQTGYVDQADRHSFTCNGGLYLDSYWLAQGVMAALYRLGGWDALLAVTAALLATLYGCLGTRLLRCGLHPLPAMLLLALALAASSCQFHVRPLVVTMAFMAWYFCLLSEVDRQERPLWHLWALVPATTLWANMHGGVLGGLGMLGLCAGAWLGQGLIGRHGPCARRRDMLRLVAIGIASLLAVTIGPYGPRLPLSWWKTLSMPLSALIEEHGPLSLGTPYGLLIVLLGGIYAFVLLGNLSAARRVTSWVPLVWFVLGCLRIRNAPLFAVTATIALADLLPQTRWAAWLAHHDWLRIVPGDVLRRPLRAWWVAPIVLVVTSLTVEAGGVAMPLVGCHWARLDPTRWPVELLPELHAIESADGTPVYNDLLYGGYLIFYTPGLRVFIDDRLELYGRFFLDYDAARRTEPGRIEEWRRCYGFGHALVEPGSAADRYLSGSGDWRLVKRCPAAALYAARTNSPAIAQREETQ